MDSVDLDATIVGNGAYRSEYSPPNSVSTFHNMPRVGGANNDFIELYLNDFDNVDEYSTGLLFGMIFLFVIFLLWGIALCVFKCIGRERVGFLTGHAFTSHSRLAKVIRWIYAFSFLMVILFSILLVTNGTLKLYDVADTVDNSNQELQQITGDLLQTIRTLRTDGNDAIQLRDALTTFTQTDVCPNQPGTAVEAEIRAAADAALVDTTDLQDFIESDLSDLETTVADFRDATLDVEDGLDDHNPTNFQLAAIIIPYLVITLMMGIVLVFGWKDIHNKAFYCIIHWLFLPLFVCLIIVAVYGSGAATMGAAANSDVCSSGTTETPEELIETIIRNEYTGSSLEFDVVLFFLRQCDRQNPLDFLDNYLDQLELARNSINQFASVIEAENVDQLRAICGRNFGPPLQDLKDLSSEMTALISNTVNGIQLIGCPRLIPIYLEVVHDGGCDVSIKALTWIFASFFLIAFFGMVMLTTRAAYQPIDEPTEAFVKDTPEFIKEEVEVVETSKDMASSQDSPQDDDAPPGSVLKSETVTILPNGQRVVERVYAKKKSEVENDEGFPPDAHVEELDDFESVLPEPEIEAEVAYAEPVYGGHEVSLYSARRGEEQGINESLPPIRTPAMH